MNGCVCMIHDTIGRRGHVRVGYAVRTLYAQDVYPKNRRSRQSKSVITDLLYVDRLLHLSNQYFFFVLVGVFVDEHIFFFVIVFN